MVHPRQRLRRVFVTQAARAVFSVWFPHEHAGQRGPCNDPTRHVLRFCSLVTSFESKRSKDHRLVADTYTCPSALSRVGWRRMVPRRHFLQRGRARYYIARSIIGISIKLLVWGHSNGDSRWLFHRYPADGGLILSALHVLIFFLVMCMSHSGHL